MIKGCVKVYAFSNLFIYLVNLIVTNHNDEEDKSKKKTKYFNSKNKQID